MDFVKVIAAVASELNTQRIRYAVIGGFAMALRGIQRATMDLDFILLLGDLERVDGVLRRHGYRRIYSSENVSHYQSDDAEWGRIDILHAFRRPSLGMLDRADFIEIGSDLRLPVAQIEDLIGLKIQAAVNDPDRAEDDWHDIRLMLKQAASAGRTVDWSLVADYLSIFHLEHQLEELKRHYGSAN